MSWDKELLHEKKKEPAKQEQKVSHSGKTSGQSGGNKRKASSGSSSSKMRPNAQEEINKLLSNMVYVQGGTFTMGATREQGSDAYSDEKPTHQVTLSSYYICKYEVTQALWMAVTGEFTNIPYCADFPADNISWNECQSFICELNHMTGKTFRLPTEAEWEFAARGGNKSLGYKYSGSNDIKDVAWCSENSDWQTHPIGTKLPNELGIYDMSGNVGEWCSDRADLYDSNSQRNPTGASSGNTRIYRGGCWSSNAWTCRTSSRSHGEPIRKMFLGLRLVLSK